MYLVHQSGTQFATIDISFRCRNHEFDIRSRINPTCHVIWGLEKVLDRRNAASFCIVPRSQPFHQFSRVLLAHLATVLFVAVNLEVLQTFFEVENSTRTTGSWVELEEVLQFACFARNPGRGSLISGNAKSVLRPKIQRGGTDHNQMPFEILTPSWAPSESQ
jgi:hypothetical protein